MSDFLRPEIRALLWRAREVLAAGAAILLGLFWGLTAFGVLAWMGWALAAAAAAFGFAALQRLRFHPGEGGPGIVEVDERRITYFGPLTGGAIGLDDLARIDIDHGARPPHWRLVDSGGSTLDIPVSATGAEALFDAFAALPGLGAEALIAAARPGGTGRHSIWRRPPSGRGRIAAVPPAD